MLRRFVALGIGFVVASSLATITTRPAAPVAATSTPGDPVFTYDGGMTGTSFDGRSSSALKQPRKAVKAVKDLSEGTIVVSFDISRAAEQSIISAYSSNSPKLCFCVSKVGIYFFNAKRGGKSLGRISSIRTGNEAGRITAVLSVSQDNGTFLMTSQDFGETWATQRDSSMKGFFSSVGNIDSLIIGNMRGRVYFVEVYDTPLTEDEAKRKIGETYLTFPGGVSYVRSGKQTFHFHIEPPGIGDSTTNYRWLFPGGDTSTKQSPVWTAPTKQNPFKDGIPGQITVTARVSSADAHHGFVETTSFFVAPSATADTTAQPGHFQTWAFENGKDGFGCYRIPAIVQAGNGDLLAFAEGRPIPCSDFQQGTSVVMKRSMDNGVTWGPLQVVAQNIVSTGRQQLAQNVTAVLDKTDTTHPDGKIVIVYNATEHEVWDVIKGKGVRRVITAWSGDHGHTWHRDPVSSPEGTNPGDITSQVAPTRNPSYKAIYDRGYVRDNYNHNLASAFRFNMPTIGHSIQLENGTDVTNGRLFISGAYTPLKSSVSNEVRRRAYFDNYVYWSDDHGSTWTIGGKVPSPDYSLNEAIAVELEDGRVLINSRAYGRTGKLGEVAGRVLTRVSFDSNGNVTFDTPTQAPDLTRRAIGAGMGRITTSNQAVFGSKSRIAFTAPNHPKCSRCKMSVWMSLDEGFSWDGYDEPKPLNRGPRCL